MRTVIAPLAPEVVAQLEALDPGLGRVARGYMARLRLEPLLGHRLDRGLLADAGVRAVYFDRHDRPEDLLGATALAKRGGGQDLSAGPRYRVVYEVLEARRAEVRVVRVLGVGRAHTDPGTDDIYIQAERLLRRLRKETP